MRLGGTRVNTTREGAATICAKNNMGYTLLHCVEKRRQVVAKCCLSQQYLEAKNK